MSVLDAWWSARVHNKWTEGSAKNRKGLRTGFTTEACAAAAAKASARCLVKGAMLSEIETTLPNWTEAPSPSHAESAWMGRALCARRSFNRLRSGESWPDKYNGDPLDCVGGNPNNLTANSKGGAYWTQGCSTMRHPR